MKTSLPSSIYSSHDLKALSFEVRRYAAWFDQSVRRQQVTGDQAGEPPALSPATAKLLEDWGRQSPLTADSLQRLQAELEAYANKAPQMVITLAEPPSAGLKKALDDWCRRNVAANVLVDFRFNATILGGMVVQFGSHIYDWSFRRQILASREKFPEILKSV